MHMSDYSKISGFATLARPGAAERFCAFKDTNPASTASLRRWKLPGGRLEWQDSVKIASCITREVREETGALIRLEDSGIFLAERHSPAGQELKIYLRAVHAGGHVSAQETHMQSLDFLHWRNLVEGPQAAAPYHAAAIRAFATGQVFRPAWLPQLVGRGLPVRELLAALTQSGYRVPVFRC